MSPAGEAHRPSHAVRWALGVGAAVMVAIGLVLLFLLTLTTNNRVLYERNYAWLFGINVVVAALLAAVLAGWVAAAHALAARAVWQSPAGQAGCHFALVGLAPGLMIYFVSYQFVSRSIESWFDVKVEGALAAGVNLARSTLEMQATDMATRTRNASVQLAQVPDSTAVLALERIRDQLGASDVVLWGAAGQMVASVGQSRFRINPERPTPQQMRTVRQQRA